MTAFINSVVATSQAQMVALIDEITRSTIIDLDYFSPVQKLLNTKATALGANTNAYPDFPLNEIVNQIKQEQPLNDLLVSELQSAEFLQEYGIKNISLGAFINPDFYIYNSYQMGAADPISNAVMKQATEAITQGQHGPTGEGWTRQEVEEGWLTGAYVDLIGENKNSKILASRTKGMGTFEEKLKL